MTQENFNKAKELQEQLAKVTKEIEGSYLPDGFMYRGRRCRDRHGACDPADGKKDTG